MLPTTALRGIIAWNIVEPTPWFPTALLPSENVRWEPIDKASARVSLTDHDITAEGSFYFNEQGQITKFKTKRYGDGKLQDWICQYHEYREAEGMHIPFYGEAGWNSEFDDFKYAKFKIKQIEYDKPSEFT